ncbi:MAG: hypothetical protein HFH36_11680 [Lachnospiraceae bacterium]|nr:hypothetical protein [Lachnospiraceae bacterium]
MEKPKKLYNQKELIGLISKDTGCPKRDVAKILNSLCGVVKDKFSDKENFVELKLFPGLKITSEYVPSEQYKSNLAGYIKSGDMLFLSAEFSRRFKDSIRELHKNS